MLLAFTTEEVVGLSAVIGGLGGAIGIIFRLLMAAKDEQIKEMREQRDSFHKAAERAVATLEGEAERRQVQRGEVPIPKIAPQISEHNSPASERQKNAAIFGTLNARLVAAQLALEGTPEAPK